MNTIENIKNRRSTKKFKSENIPDEIIFELIDCGRRASFGGPPKKKCQVSEFIIITDQKIKNALALEYEDRQFIKDAPIIIACCANTKNDPEYMEWDISVSLSIENILLAANELSLGGCIITAFTKHKKHTKDREKLIKILKIPDHIYLMALITIGYRDVNEEIPEKELRDFEEIVHTDTYGRKYNESRKKSN